MDDEIPVQKTRTPVFLNFFQSRPQRDVGIWVNIMFIFISIKTEIARSASGQK